MEGHPVRVEPQDVSDRGGGGGYRLFAGEEMSEPDEAMKKLSNPFYDNHIFNSHDLARSKIKFRDCLWLWLFPTLTQINTDKDCLFAFHFKVVNGQYYLMGIEEIYWNEEKQSWRRTRDDRQVG